MSGKVRFALLGLIALLTLACTGPATTPPPVGIDLTEADREVGDLLRNKFDAAREAPQDARLRAELAMAYEANGFVRAALESYEQALGLDASEPRWWYLTAILHARVGDRDAALEALARAIELNASYAPAFWRRGEWLLDLGETDRAEQSFREAARVAPDDPAGWVGLARVHLRRGQAEEAAGILERLVGTRPTDAYLHHLLGTAYRQLGELDKARVELTLGKSARKKWSDPWREEVGRYRTGFSASIDKAKALIAAARYDEAIELLDSLRQERPLSVLVLNNLSVAYLRSGKIDQALQVLEIAHTEQPDYFPTHLNLSGAYERLGDSERALLHVERAIEINPTLANAHQRKGVILLRERRFEEALASLETALEYDAGNPKVLLYAGVAAGELKRWELAIRYLEQAGRQDPRSLQAQLALLFARIETGALDEAEAALNRARQLNPQHPRVLDAENKLRRARLASEQPG